MCGISSVSVLFALMEKKQTGIKLLDMPFASNRLMYQLLDGSSNLIRYLPYTVDPGQAPHLLSVFWDVLFFLCFFIRFQQ